MSTFILIIKILPWVLSLAGFVVGLFQTKKSKSQKALINLQKNELHNLRNQIVQMVELQGDKNEVVRKTKKGKKNIDNVTDEQLSIDYANKLHNVPTRKRK